jgi:hypothetical protein
MRMTKTETNKLRNNLTPEQKEKAIKMGRVSFRSNRKRFRSHGDVRKFIPSREQH